MAISDVFAERLLADAGVDLDAPVRVRLVVADPMSSLTIPAGGIVGYELRAGDVWLAGVLRPPGVPVTGPDGWTRAGQIPGVVDEASGRVGDLVLFTRMMAGDEPGFVATFPGAGWARLVVRVYRGEVGEDNAVGAAVVEMESPEHG